MGIQTRERSGVKASGDENCGWQIAVTIRVGGQQLRRVNIVL
jgi:hypothetical protein